MAMATMLWMLAISLLGLATGMRTMTPIAVLCWFAYLKFLPVGGTWAFWTASLVSAVLFTLLALGEFVGDKLPRTPNRTSPAPLAARLVFGGLIGAIATTALKESRIEGVLIGVIGAAVGAYGGLVLRREVVKRMGCADWQFAVGEDAFAVLCAVFAMHLLTS